jgi:hypothetical protein
MGGSLPPVWVRRRGLRRASVVGGSHRTLQVALGCKRFRFANLNKLWLGFNAAAGGLQVAVVAARRLFYLLLLADELLAGCELSPSQYRKTAGPFLRAMDSVR